MFLGIEIGGTKLQLGLGAGDGALAALWRDTVDPAQGADGIRRQITRAVPLVGDGATHPGRQLWSKTHESRITRIGRFRAG